MVLRVVGGILPDALVPLPAHARAVPQFLLVHGHTADECAVAFAAWTGFASPLRGQSTWGSCLTGGHRLWWTVQADDAAAALAYLPAYVARRTEVVRVDAVAIP